ncbi:hypothetical protein CPB86DRAFT_803114, partial [Serendipita vermifera]
ICEEVGVAAIQFNLHLSNALRSGSWSRATLFTRSSQAFHKLFTNFTTFTNSSQAIHKLFTNFSQASQGTHKVFTNFPQASSQGFSQISIQFVVTSFRLARGYSITRFSLSDLKLSSLHIEDRTANKNLTQLGRFEFLKSLTYITNSSQSMDQVSLNPIHFPVLEDLTLRGDFRPIIITLFDAPSLETLQLRFYSHTYGRDDHMEARIYFRPSVISLDTFSDPEVIPKMGAFLRFLLPQLMSVVFIGITKNVEDILIDSVKRMRREQSHLLSSLEALYRWDTRESGCYTRIYEVPETLSTEQSDS